MRFFYALGIVAYATNCAAASDSSRPRGVSPEFAKYYKDTVTFSCISNPSFKIPFSAVNDDYCDCPDGSDEPGTSACSHISRTFPSFISLPEDESTNRTPALPGFYCANKGHNPSYIPFQRVNDGVCDYDICCDGSDEWAHVGGVKCENKCKEIGKEWRKKEEQRLKSQSAAIQKRKELVQTASRMQKEIEDRISQLEAEVQASEQKVESLQKELDEVRTRERGKAVKGQKRGKVNELAGLAKARVGELRNALIHVRRQKDKVHARLVELEGILSRFKEEYNPNFNDEGVKRAVRSWEDYAAREAGKDEGNDPPNLDLDEICKEDSENSGIDWSQWENEQDEETEVSIVYKITSYLPPYVTNSIEDMFRNFKSWLASNGVISNADPGSDESKAVQDARQRLSAAESSLKQTQSKLKKQKSDLEGDFGKDSVFRSMKGSCISKESGEYTYELCWMEKAKQKPKKGAGSTNMGSFVRISSITVDEATSSGQIVQRERLALDYSNGQKCWNGPTRSTTVILECGEKDEILKVTEDEKCVYSMYVATPAVCEPANVDQRDTSRKDEL
ncbi:hypothetical protein VTO42DRAFT_7279 [Malbranchea cinnamomea]